MEESAKSKTPNKGLSQLKDELQDIQSAVLDLRKSDGLSELIQAKKEMDAIRSFFNRMRKGKPQVEPSNYAYEYGLIKANLSTTIFTLIEEYFKNK